MGIVTVIILTYNEQLHIARAMDSVAPFAASVVVVDSFSTDRTVEIARAKGAIVLQNKFINQAKQFQWALDNAPLDTPWLMRLDADEVVSPELAAEILAKVPQLPADIVGVNMKRRHIWMGRWVRHGDRYPLVMLRLWRRGFGRIEDRWMDEHMLVWGGKTLTFDADFSDINLNDIGYFIDKHNKYATREAIEILNKRIGLFAGDSGVSAKSTSWQAGTKRWLKDNFFGRVPFTLSAPAYFLYRYIFRLGFLDGRTGLIYHFLQGYWYRFLVGAKVVELEAAVGHLQDKSQIAAELSRLTGQSIRVDLAAEQ